MSLNTSISGVSAVNPALPILRRDKLAVAGCQFLFDAAHPFCTEGRASLTPGLTMRNLVVGAPVATVAGSGSIALDGKGMVFDGASVIYLDLGGTYGLFGSDHAFVAAMTISGPASRAVTDQGIFGCAYAATDNEFMFRQNGANPIIAYADGRGGLFNGSASDLLPNAAAYGPLQYAVAWVPVTGGSVVRTYKNGIQTGEVFNADADLSTATGVSTTRLGGAAQQATSVAWKGTIHRAAKWDMTVNGGSIAQLVYEDYQRNLGRFV